MDWGQGVGKAIFKGREIRFNAVQIWMQRKDLMRELKQMNGLLHGLSDGLTPFLILPYSRILLVLLSCQNEGAVEPC